MWPSFACRKVPASIGHLSSKRPVRFVAPAVERAHQKLPARPRAFDYHRIYRVADFDRVCDPRFVFGIVAVFGGFVGAGLVFLLTRFLQKKTKSAADAFEWVRHEDHRHVRGSNVIGADAMPFRRVLFEFKNFGISLEPLSPCAAIPPCRS